jgi:hypothetical protein
MSNTKPTSNEAENGNKSKPLLLGVIRQLTTRGFSLKDRDIKNDKRLGIHLSLKNKTGKYIEIYDEKTYWFILHYGFDGKYLPIGFCILFQKDVSEYGKFLTAILANNQ